jgi:hypothetical protein
MTVIECSSALPINTSIGVPGLDPVDGAGGALASGCTNKYLVEKRETCAEAMKGIEIQTTKSAPRIAKRRKRPP